MFGLEGEKEKVHTWFKVGGALVREHRDHVSVYAGNGRAIGESTQTRLPESSDGVAASITWRNGAEGSNCCPTRNQLDKCRKKGVTTRMALTSLH